MFENPVFTQLFEVQCTCYFTELLITLWMFLTIDGLQYASLTAFFDIKQVHTCTRCAQLSANDSSSRMHNSSKMAGNDIYCNPS